MVMLKRKRKRSRTRKSLTTPKSRLRIGGPARMLNPELPKRPTLSGLEHTGVVAGQPGMAKALASNQWATERPEERLPSPTRSGTPPMVLVLETSKLVNDGVKYWPDCTTTVQVVRHPPSIA